MKDISFERIYSLHVELMSSTKAFKESNFLALKLSQNTVPGTELLGLLLDCHQEWPFLLWSNSLLYHLLFIQQGNFLFLLFRLTPQNIWLTREAEAGTHKTLSSFLHKLQWFVLHKLLVKTNFLPWQWWLDHVLTNQSKLSMLWLSMRKASSLWDELARSIHSFIYSFIHSSIQWIFFEGPPHYKRSSWPCGS